MCMMSQVYVTSPTRVLKTESQHLTMKFRILRPSLLSTFALTLSYMFKCYSTEYCYLWRPQFKQYILCLRFRRRGRTFNKCFLLRASSFRGCICITHRPLYILPINIFIHDNPSLTCWWLSNVLCKHDSQLVSLCYTRYKYMRQNGHSCFAIECRRLIQFNNTICSFKSHGLSISF